MTRLRNRHFFLSDLLLLLAAGYLSHVLRLESFDLGVYWPSFLFFAGVALFVMPFVFWRVGLYARYWRYASVDELLLLTGTVTAATLLIAALSIGGSRLVLGSYTVPRSIPFIFLLLALAATAGPRLAVRSTTRYGYRRMSREGAMPILVVGAGNAGLMIVREMQHNPQLGMEPVGFIDDDPTKQEMHIHGIPVLGDRSAIARVVQSYKVRRVIIAMPTAPGKVIREIVTICEEVEVETRTIPGIYELLDGTVGVRQLREVKIEDLLRRDPVQINAADLQNLLRGRRILVTGGGGSIGSELCRQIAQFQPAQLILLDQFENNVFYISNELQHHFPTLPLAPVIANIRDRAHLDAIYRKHRPEIIFHAAAHKHVPLMEHNACEAILNNVVGTRNLVELAAEHGVEQFVMISTDKAVNPTSVMGVSKRCAERIVQRVARTSGRPYVAVRFGNVLGSSGSVVPLFKQQIAAGGPVTVTHPDMYRYFMTIPEAVQLVLQAAALGNEGEIFVLDMGDPVRILDLARDLISLSGLHPDEDIEIVFTGLRPGEKLVEELSIEGEKHQRTLHEKIFVLKDDLRHHEDEAEVLQQIERLIAVAQSRDDQALRPLLRLAVPEYQPTDPPSRPVPPRLRAEEAPDALGSLLPRYSEGGA